jgi:hypothetical protein
MVRQATVEINVFMIPPGEIARLKAKLVSTGMTVIKRVEQDDCHREFYYSIKPDALDAPRVESFQGYFKDLGTPKNTSYLQHSILCGPTCASLSVTARVISTCARIATTPSVSNWRK